MSMSHRAARACTVTLLAAMMLAGTARAQPRFDFDATPGRLSKDVLPTHVQLDLTLDPARDDFSGRARIALTLRRPQAALVVHAHRLEPQRLLLVTAERSVALARESDEALQTWRLTPVDGTPVPAGPAWLEVDYTGEVHDTGEGLYRARSAGGPMLATQLQAVFARTVFPAFDEPAFRSVFALTVRAPERLEVIGNMPPVAGRAGDAGVEPGWRVHRFAPTPPMPAYLLAVAVGRFGKLHGRAAGVPVRVLTAPGREALGREALRWTEALLPYYTRYFGTPYALPKLDQLAVPSTRSGAMEDWGLISYSERWLLVDPARTGTDQRQYAGETIAHEVAHQWFGNLVTAASWDEIWLNEAFASWISVKAVDAIRPEWRWGLAQRLPTDDAMRRDAGDATRAIRSGPVSEQTVFDVFDDITYEKGRAVLAMLERWIGEEGFRRGLAAYLRDRRFSNATAGDLWHHIGVAAGRDVSAVAASWTDQPGFPLVEVESACPDGRTRVTLRQRPFTTGPARPGDAERLWRIPLQLTHRGRTTSRLFDQPEAAVVLPGCDPLPVRLNVSGDAFHRTAYDREARARLRADFARLPASEQVTLLSDSHALFEAGLLPLREHVALLERLPRVTGEARPLLFTIAVNQFERLDRVFAGTEVESAWHAASRALLAPELARLGWQPRAGEAAEASALRSRLIERLARDGDAAVRQRAGELFDLDERGLRRLPASIREGVTLAAGIDADAARSEQLLQRLRTAESEEDRQLFSRALASGADPQRAEQLLALMLTDIAPPNIRSRFPGRVAQLSPHAALAWRHVLAHWNELADAAGRMWGVHHWLLPGVADAFRTASDAERLLAEQARLAGPAGAAPAAQVAAEIRLRAAIWAREREAVSRWLPAWRPSPGP